MAIYSGQPSFVASSWECLCEGTHPAFEPIQKIVCIATGHSQAVHPMSGVLALDLRPRPQAWRRPPT